LEIEANRSQSIWEAKEKVTMKKLTVLILILIAVLALAACNTAPEATPTPKVTVVSPDAVIAEGHIVPNDFLYLSFPVRGKVAEILVENGDTVKEGDVLIRLADREQAEASLSAAQAELTAAQQAYDEFIRLADLSHAQAWLTLLEAQAARAEAQTTWDELDIDEIDDRIDEAEAEVNDTLDVLEDAQDEFAKYENLSENNASRQDAKDEMDQAEEDYNEAVRVLEETQREKDIPRATLDQALTTEAEAKRDFENTLSGPDAEQLSLLENRLASAEAQVAAAEKALSNYDLTAPFDGTVVDVNVSVHEMIGPENWSMLVADFSDWFVETSDLTELEVVKISKGQEAAIVPDALPELEMVGIVDEINQGYYVQGGDISYRVKLSLDEVDPALRWGMTVEITFNPKK
jgi:multidrug efflux pump subunit AcrA (membrane-fusion protein)